MINFRSKKYRILRTLKNSNGCLVRFSTDKDRKTPVLRGVKALQSITNWLKPEVVMKGLADILCHLKKLIPKQIPKGIVLIRNLVLKYHIRANRTPLLIRTPWDFF